MKHRGEIRIGTSGWHYGHWKGPFYPGDLSAERFLEYYARHFGTVEINNTFYRMPDKGTLAVWRDTVPARFLFTVKASRYITHMKKLKDAKKPLMSFLQATSALEEKLGPILFQLPPRWKRNNERLASFLSALPGEERFAFEFRDPSWFNEEVYEALRDAGAAFCIYQLAGLQSPRIVTADFAYIRLHGPGKAYEGQYSVKDLERWAETLSAWSREGKDVYCYFDNDQAGYAALDALKLRALMKERGA